MIHIELELNEQQVQSLQAGKTVVVQLPIDSCDYVLIRRDAMQEAGADEGDLTRQEKDTLLARAVESDDWGDPEMSVYDGPEYD